MPDPRASDLDVRIDRLYQLPLGEFTDARNRLAAELKKAGDAGAAARVKTLAKPSLAAWAVNQLYWSARSQFDAVVKAGDRLRAAQQALLVGRDAKYREAAEAREQAVARAIEEASALMARAGESVTAATQERLARTLEAIATYGSAGAAPPAGRLTEDLDPPGLEALAGLTAAAAVVRPARETRAGGAEAEPERPRESPLAGQLERARAALIEAESALRAWRSDAERAEQMAAQVAERAGTAREDVDEAKQRLADAMKRATRAIDEEREARRQSAQGAATLKKAEQAAADARAAVKSLERRLDAERRSRKS